MSVECAAHEVVHEGHLDVDTLLCGELGGEDGNVIVTCGNRILCAVRAHEAGLESGFGHVDDRLSGCRRGDVEGSCEGSCEVARSVLTVEEDDFLEVFYFSGDRELEESGHVLEIQRLVGGYSHCYGPLGIE